MALSKSALRSQARANRKQLSRAIRQRAAHCLARQFTRSMRLKKARHIAIYLASGSEIATEPLIQHLLKQRRIHLYAPKIAAHHRLKFIQLTKHSPRIRHSHGMHQPWHHCHKPLRRMDLILLPLLAFDNAGNRLGQGGGYYDRALSRLSPYTPYRVGLAYTQQQVKTISCDPHDQALHGVLTPKGFIRARSK